MNSNIDIYLNNSNWKFERINDTTIVSGFKGDSATYTLFIFDADEWVYFITYANLLPIPAEQRNELSFILAKLNHDTPFVKFSIDGKSNIVVSVELPNFLINETSVNISLETLCAATEFINDLLPDYHEITEPNVS